MIVSQLIKVTFLLVIVLLASSTPLFLITPEDALRSLALRLFREADELKQMARQ